MCCGSSTAPARGAPLDPESPAPRRECLCPGQLPADNRDARAGRRETDDRLPAIVVAIKGADPDITLQAICDRLVAMRERTPRGRASRQPSSEKMLLERPDKLGVL